MREFNYTDEYYCSKAIHPASLMRCINLINRAMIRGAERFPLLNPA